MARLSWPCWLVKYKESIPAVFSVVYCTQQDVTGRFNTKAVDRHVQIDAHVVSSP